MGWFDVGVTRSRTIRSVCLVACATAAVWAAVIPGLAAGATRRATSSANRTTRTSHSIRAFRASRSPRAGAATSACDPGANTNPIHIFVVTLKCVFSGQVFYDPNLKLKSRCIASVGFDVLTDAIPAGKIKLLKDAAKPIGRSAKTLASDLAKTRLFDKKLIDGLDNLGKAMTLVTHHPKDVVALFLTSDRVLERIAKVLGTRHPVALQHLRGLQKALKGLFLSLTGLADVEKCRAAFSPPPRDQRFTGETSEGSPVTLVVHSGKTVDFKVSYPESCQDPYGNPRGSASGWFHSTALALTNRQPQSFSIHWSANGIVTDEGDETFDAVDDLYGKIKGSAASGTFSFVGQFYDLYGDYLGPCETGTLYWTAHSTS